MVLINCFPSFVGLQLHTVLENEAAQTLEAKAALEEAFKEMERVKNQLHVSDEDS